MSKRRLRPLQDHWIDQLDDFAAKELLVGVAASAAVPDTSPEAGFKFAHFRLVALGN